MGTHLDLRAGCSGSSSPIGRQARPSFVATLPRRVFITHKGDKLRCVMVIARIQDIVFTHVGQSGRVLRLSAPGSLRGQPLALPAS